MSQSSLINRNDGSILNVGSLKLCRDTHSLIIGDDTHHLRNKLFGLLEHLFQQKNRLVSREELINTIWNGNYYIGEKGLTHAVCMLRNLLKKDSSLSVSIDTIPKTGYRLRIKNEEREVEKQADTLEKNNIFTIETKMPNWWPRNSSFNLMAES